ncbi:receptor-like serine/threonine-protein kinase ALE2 isoform X1 [Musa acuminata AAA Group]|uniref:receptor-like serine/threonine-protein kinase ALE2 isoform X1 n=1 Tax=Musa acuminata AAA Group TaxID=214697 RepID=UPI0031E0EB89
MMRVFAMLVLCLHLGTLCCAINKLRPALSPARSPEVLPKAIMGPGPAPAFAPKHHVHSHGPLAKHHHRMPHAPSPTLSIPPRGQADCDEVICSEPLTSTPIGSPCGCVSPMRVVIDLGVAPYLLFTHIAEFEVEVATGTFLKQSQVKIMAAFGLIQNQGKTRVTIYLVPLGEKFDTTTALLIYERLWQKKVSIEMSLFGDYEVIYVHYPGLPSSPPSVSDGSTEFRPSNNGNHQYPFTADVSSGRARKLNAGIIAVISVSSFTLILACIGIVLFILKWKNLRQPSPPQGSAVTQSDTGRSGIKSTISNSVASSPSASFISVMAACPPSLRTFSMAELEKATDKFCSEKVLGEGGFGRVYHGIMNDGNEVAVKLLNKGNQNGEHEFISEVEMVSRLHHRNLVKLIGICIEGNKRCLVYELVRNGSVESHLHGADKKKGPLDWDARMRIALGAARGLAYLHEDSNPHVIHRDFKASNILLEEDFTAKVTDFGLAREASEGSQHISTQVMGTFGYVAPEYAMTGHLLVKSDVYSYGVVLLELLSGRKPVYMSESEGPENLVTWARSLLASREGVEKLMDPSLHGKCDLDDVARVAAIASMCVHAEPSQRPFMGEVVQALKLIYNDMEETCEGSYSQKESSTGMDDDYRGDFGAESSWWRNGVSPLSYRHGSPFITMDYSSDPMDELQRPHSTSQLASRTEARYNRSGPLRTKKKISDRLRGSISEHEHHSRHLGMKDHYGSSL